jgi:hypothetical protein
VQESPDISHSVEQDSGDIPEFLAVRSCMFQRVDLHPDPASLVEEFLDRDASGQFLRTDKWFDQATTCPGHEPGPDAFLTIADYHFETLFVSDTVARYVVTYEILGLVIPALTADVFRPNEGMRIDTLTVVSTAYGWRIKSPALLQRVFADTVLTQPWLPDADRQELEHALAGRPG